MTEDLHYSARDGWELRKLVKERDKLPKKWDKTIVTDGEFKGLKESGANMDRYMALSEFKKRNRIFQEQQSIDKAIERKLERDRNE